MTYRPRTAPARFFEGAPEIVRKNVLDLLGPHSDTPCPYDVMFKPEYSAPFHSIEIVGLDFDAHGARGCHFFLRAHEARDYREKHRRKRVAWADLPEPTQRAIVTYLES